MCCLRHHQLIIVAVVATAVAISSRLSTLDSHKIFLWASTTPRSRSRVRNTRYSSRVCNVYLLFCYYQMHTLLSDVTFPFSQTQSSSQTPTSDTKSLLSGDLRRRPRLSITAKWNGASWEGFIVGRGGLMIILTSHKQHKSKPSPSQQHDGG